MQYNEARRIGERLAGRRPVARLSEDPGDIVLPCACQRHSQQVFLMKRFILFLDIFLCGGSGGAPCCTVPSAPAPGFAEGVS